MEIALNADFTHYSDCKPPCTCGLDGMNMYLGRQP